MFTQKHTGLYYTFTLALFGVFLSSSPPALGYGNPAIDINRFVRESGFVFKGEVIDIVYKNSEGVPLIDPNTGRPVLDPNGNPIYEEGTSIPHTFVTYQIDEIYKGEAPEAWPGGPPDSNVTLRFLGGQSQTDTSEYLMVSNIPFFDVNDRDILFVTGNTGKSCPLVDWYSSRLRILIDPCDPNVRPEPKIYNELGLEVRFVAGVGTEPDNVILGPFHSLEQINTHDMGDFILKKVTVNEGNEFELPGANDVPEPNGTQFTEDVFNTYLTEVVLAECGTVPPGDCGSEVVNADESQSFTAVPIPVAEPNFTTLNPEPYSRPWLDRLDPEEKAQILEAERKEHELLLLTRGNPVLPKTPCEISNLRYGAMAGDVSGPEGRPDCRIDFHDVSALASRWLEYFEPELSLTPLCIE